MQSLEANAGQAALSLPSGRQSLRAPGKSSIRAGFGRVYDRVGESLVDTFDQNGSFGLFTELTNPSAVQTSQTAPRLTSLNTIPTTDYTGAPIFIPAPAANFPQPFPSSLATGGSAITWGIDDKLKTPYAYTLDFAISRQLSSSFSLDLHTSEDYPTASWRRKIWRSRSTSTTAKPALITSPPPPRLHAFTVRRLSPAMLLPLHRSTLRRSQRKCASFGPTPFSHWLPAERIALALAPVSRTQLAQPARLSPPSICFAQLA